MRADFDAWAKANGVLPMPEGYNPSKQVLINTFVNYWIPEYRNPALSVAAVLAAAVAAWIVRRRRRRPS